MDQVRSLRSRAVLERMTTHQDAGAFLRIGNSCKKVLSAAGNVEGAEQLCGGCLPPEDAGRAENMPSVIRRLTIEEYDLLFRNGFEVADYTLYAYHPDEFRYIGYKPYL
jgi:hypothetical protein